jgi:hypothetical protein
MIESRFVPESRHRFQIDSALLDKAQQGPTRMDKEMHKNRKKHLVFTLSAILIRIAPDHHRG